MDTILTTADEIPGRTCEVIGIVKGNTIQTKNIGRDFTQGLKSLVGGELEAYTKLLSEAREVATDRMVKEAQGLGADAIVCIRYSTASVMQGAAEMMVYGTAVRFV